MATDIKAVLRCGSLQRQPQNCSLKDLGGNESMRCSGLPSLHVSRTSTSGAMLPRQHAEPQLKQRQLGMTRLSFSLFPAFISHILTGLLSPSLRIFLPYRGAWSSEMTLLLSLTVTYTAIARISERSTHSLSCPSMVASTQH